MAADARDGSATVIVQSVKSSVVPLQTPMAAWGPAPGASAAGPRVTMSTP